MMEYVHLGRTGLRVSRLCLGAGCFGYVSGKLFGNLGMTEERSFELMDLALARGINFFDTADAYGWDQGVGLSESIIGRWFAQDRGRRDQVVLSTKVYFTMSPEYPKETVPNQRGLSALHIKKACEESLRRLGTDHIDIYMMHHVDRSTPWEEIWQAMEQLVREGKVLYIGSSNFAGWDIATANEMSKQRNFLGLVMEQCAYNLLNRKVEMEVLPACAAYGLGVVPWEPLAEGVLAGAFRKSLEGYRGMPHVSQRIERNRAPLEAYERLCAELNEPPAAVALAWLLHNPIVTAPSVGFRKAEHLESAVRAVDLKLSQETLSCLNQIFPGPGTAPDIFFEY
jgi:aryl-alcohol dehydrogenase-like predicted oxidoreductase